jgi:DNA-binding HxlR family transcriptional regulator
MAAGLIVAIVVTTLWVLIQIATVHMRSLPNGMRPMMCAYLISLPFVWLLYWLCLKQPQLMAIAEGEDWLMGLMQSYFFHFMLFLLYVECFYHIERSVTLRLLIEVLNRSGEASLTEIQHHYNVDDMITRRMKNLEDAGYVKKRYERWRNTAKGTRICWIMNLSTWLFKSVTQSRRM